MIDGSLLSDETCEELKEKILTSSEYFKYGRYPFYPALNVIADNLQTICEVYRKFPLTCIQLLEQVKQPDSAHQYQNKVIDPILAKYQAAKNRNDNSMDGLYFIAKSLGCLRQFMGDDEVFINKTFAREISILICEDKEDKHAVYSDVVAKMCRSLITATIEHIHSLTCEPHQNKILTI